MLSAAVLLSAAETVLGSRRLQTPECGWHGVISDSCIERESCSDAVQGCLKCELLHNQYPGFPQEDAQWCSFCSVTQMNRYYTKEGDSCSRVSDRWERLWSCLCTKTLVMALSWPEWGRNERALPGIDQPVVTLHIHVPSQLLLQSKT